MQTELDLAWLNSLRPSNVERTYLRSLDFSELLRLTPDARHLDLDVVRWSPSYDLLYIAEVTHGDLPKKTFLTQKLGEELGVPAYLFRYFKDGGKIVRVMIYKLARNNLQLMIRDFPPEEFTKWDANHG